MDTKMLASVIVTLNKVEVKGADNMTRLLGSIRSLEEILKGAKAGEADNQQRENI